MAGHSKWKQIKHKKAATDAKRASAWTKVIREITVAAKAGGGDPGGNPRLRTAVDAAKAVNMPNENIDRAIKKGTGELEGAIYEEVAYEGYGPGGAAIYVEATTDNANRTVAEVRHAFSRNNGNLGSSNSVAWMFDRKGQLSLDATRWPEDRALEDALEAGAEDFAREGDEFLVTTAPNDFHAVQDALRARGTPSSRRAWRWCRRTPCGSRGRTPSSCSTCSRCSRSWTTSPGSSRTSTSTPP